ncbi:MAG: hypothetical protein PHY93_17820 [Bacteriovorax sp.]|nr:hypothetical protein [Bacteriovorax sp.]
MLELNNLNLEIAVLYCPYANIENKTTRDVFSKLLRLKNRGYGNRHELGALPLDANDFVADHPLICIRDDEGNLEPVSGSKVITYDLCKYFNLEFAMESCFKKGNKEKHLQALSQILNDTQSNNRTLAYHGGYTIDPKVRSDLILTEQIRELFIGSTALYFKEHAVTDLLGLGVPKFKTENFFYDWGYERCQENGENLEEFPLIFLPNTNGVMMHLKEYSHLTMSLAEKYKELWNNRTKIGSPFVIPDIKQKEAA